MEKYEDLKTVKRYYEKGLSDSVEVLFDQSLSNIAEAISYACYSVHRDDNYDNESKSDTMLRCMNLMVNLISVYENYNLYKESKVKLDKFEHHGK